MATDSEVTLYTPRRELWQVVAINLRNYYEFLLLRKDNIFYWSRGFPLRFVIFLVLLQKLKVPLREITNGDNSTLYSPSTISVVTNLWRMMKLSTT